MNFFSWNARSATGIGYAAVVGAMGLILSSGSCIDVQLGGGGVSIGSGSAFIVGGFMEIDERGHECSRFRADNGVTYHLFQGSRLTNDEFDLLFEEGSRSRLEIKIRTDLDLRCKRGPIVEVVDILEFIPADQIG